MCESYAYRRILDAIDRLDMCTLNEGVADLGTDSEWNDGSKTFTCQSCNKEFMLDADELAELSRSTGADEPECDYCGKIVCDECVRCWETKYRNSPPEHQVACVGCAMKRAPRSEQERWRRMRGESTSVNGSVTEGVTDLDTDADWGTPERCTVCGLTEIQMVQAGDYDTSVSTCPVCDEFVCSKCGAGDDGDRGGKCYRWDRAHMACHDSKAGDFDNNDNYWDSRRYR